MKKIITFLFCFGIFATSFAQYNYGRDQRYDDDGYNRRDPFDHDHFNAARVRDFQIQKINRDFEFQIQAIQNNRYMRHHEKKQAIRNAKNERERQIQLVNARFSNFRFNQNRYDNHWDNRRNNW